MRTLSGRERKLVAIAILLGAIALVWLGLVQPLISGFSDRAERRAELSREYVQNERLIGRIAALRRAAEAQRAKAADYAIAAENAGQAGELLKTRLADSFGRAGGELRATDAVEPAAGWVRAGVTGVMSYDQLITLLDHLSQDPPYLVLDALSVNADRAVNSNNLDLMDVHLEASIPFAPAKPR
jgi:general secretion pathway protein M